MEAVPRLPMISFELKHTTGSTSFANLKLYIAECYQEDPDTYSKEVYALDSLRNAACRPSIDVNGCNTLKRYYCQLHSLQSRFPLTSERQLLQFSWRDVFSNSVTQATDVRFEMAVALYNYGVLHGMLGASNDRTTPDGMKLACTHFQCAAWAFNHLREQYPQATSGDMSAELLVFQQELSYGQAQECILEKSLADNRKAGIVSKVTAQIISYYNAAYSALLNSGEDGPVSDVIGSKHFKEWRRYVKFKISYLGAILLLYQGQQSEEQQKMGERVTLYQAAWDKLEEARKESKGMANTAAVNESIAFVSDVIEAKRKAAKNENEFIYHEEVPDISTFSAIQGANLVKGIGFSVTDPDAIGEDIFHRLVPMKAHEASSLYSEEKANLLRKISAKVEEKDTELNKFMASLNVESLNLDNQSTRLPQALVDRCAALNAKTNAITDLVTAMSNLAEICTDVECMLTEIRELLSEEERLEQSFQKTMAGARTTVNFTELQREFSKYQEAHNKAGESNETLRKAMGLHVANLKALAQPLSDVQAAVPTCGNPQEDNESIKELHILLAKVNEMRMQRALLYGNLRAAVTKDDITTQVISWGDKKLEKLFKKELSKHEKTIQLIEQNLLAQPNVLRALTECYARCASQIKTMIDTKHRREHFFTTLTASYDVYDDLLSKSSKGLEFYKKLQGNINKLLSRIRGARDVQDEERQQRLQSTKIGQQIATGVGANTIISSEKSQTPKLKDYLKSGSTTSIIGSTNDLSANIPTIRPTPVGSETTTVSTCITMTFKDKYYSPHGLYQNSSSQQQHLPNEPPPPYAAFSTIDNSGYTNPIYQNPPPYNLHNVDPSMINVTYSSLHQQQQQQQYSGNIISPTQNVVSSSFQNYTASTANTARVSIAADSTDVGQKYPDQSYQIGNYQLSFQQTTAQDLQSQYHFIQQQQQPLPQPNISQSSALATIYQPTSQPNLASHYQIAGHWNEPSNLSQQISNLSLNNTENLQYNQTSSSSSPYVGIYSANDQLITNQQDYNTIAPSSIVSYTTSMQPNYQFTANNRYITGYDQTASVPSAQQNQTFTSHPGYVLNPQTGEYQYGSGYQDRTDVQNFYTQYTNVNMDQTSNTTESTNLGANGQSFADQYANTTSATTCNQSAITLNANVLYNTTSGSYYNIPYGTQSCNVQTTVTTSLPSTSTSSAPSTLSSIPQNSQQFIELNGERNFKQNTAQSMVYMQSNSNINTRTSSSNQLDNTSKQYDEQNQQYLDNLSIQQHQHQQQEHQQGLQGYYQQQQQVDQQNYSQQLPQQQLFSVAPHQYDEHQKLQSLQEQQQQVQQQQHQLFQQQQEQQPIEQQQQQQQQNLQLQHLPLQEQLSQIQPSVLSEKSEKVQPKCSSVAAKTTSNIDLLSDIDLNLSDSSIISIPLLQPKPVSRNPIDNDNSMIIKKNILPSIATTVTTTAATTIPTTHHSVNDDKFHEIGSTGSLNSMRTTNRKSSIDNLSVCSDVSSIDQNLDWDSTGLLRGDERKLSADGEAIMAKYKDTQLDDLKTMKWFHKEVERLEKIMETLNIKTLNGTTHLDNKWKEIQDLLVKDESKRSISVAKLFPEKNRSFDSIPYDHARVLLPTNTDDYINAVHLKEIGSGSPPFILAQTPLANTVRDFWCMIWAQKTTTVVCLHSPTEMLDPFFPQEMHKETNYGDYSVIAVKQFDLSHCIERIVKVSMMGADAILTISIVQVKTWPKNSPVNILGVSQNVITTYKQQKQSLPTCGPIILNCIFGTERSGLVALAIAAILATSSPRKPILINAVDVWYRICSQRKGALRDISTLELSMQIVLNNAHEILNKSGIMTSYQMKNAQATIIAEKEEINDPFSDLDPLWKLKQKK